MEVVDKVAVPSGFDLLLEKISTGDSNIKIAERYNTTHQNIRQKIQRVIASVNPEIQNLYLTKPNDAIKAVESLLISELSNPDKIQKANLVQLSTAFGTIYDKRRLEEGKSTDNIDFRALLAMESDIRSRISEPVSVNDIDTNDDE